jgi:RHS repeat-associated protein
MDYNNPGIQSGDKIMAQNYYDALGQLTTKKIGQNYNAPLQPVETQNYEYNIRGWLLGVNRNYISNGATGHSFGFDLAYDKVNNSSTNTALQGYAGSGLFNGNITGMTWRGVTGAKEIRRYDYAYDAANRLLKADFKDFANSSFNTAYDVKMGDGINADQAYDYNGNIKAMQQYGLYQNNIHLIDNLSYTYKESGLSNKLAKVTDGQTTDYQLGDFKNGANTDDDYDYDINGNLIKDQNKGISSISYNILNLPEQIVVDNKGTISYTYDAAGNKLSKTVNETGQAAKTTQYLGGMIFENNVLQHVATEEGRVRLASGQWRYDYFLKDHLGNVRVMLNDIAAPLEETHYYPFGLTQRGISTRQTGSLHNKEKTFQDQQIDEDLDLNWVQFKYRNHDPQIGRFIEVDPLSGDYPHNSTYAFSENRVVNGVELEGLEYMTYGYNAAGVRANIQATAQRSSRSDAEKKQELATTIDMTPGVGDVKGFVEAFRGRDLVTGEKLGWGSRLLGLVFLSELRTVGKVSDAVRAGKWIDAGESMSDAAASYQKQITGISAEKSFKVDGVKFDGITKEGVLLDAKSGMENFVGKDGKFQNWFKGADGLVDQANSQLKAADGTKIQWHFENKSVMEATKKLFKERKIEGIDFIYTERKKQ